MADLFLYTSPPGKLVPLHFTPGRPVPLYFTPWQTCSFTLHPMADLFLYTSPPGKLVPLHFTPGRPVPLYFAPADLILYTSPLSKYVPLHFTPWLTCSYILHPLADLFLYTSPPGRPVPLHFSPWQTCSFHHQLDFSGKFSATLQLVRRPLIHLHPSFHIDILHYTTEIHTLSVAQTFSCLRDIDSSLVTLRITPGTYSTFGPVFDFDALSTASSIWRCSSAQDRGVYSIMTLQ